MPSSQTDREFNASFDKFQNSIDIRIQKKKNHRRRLPLFYYARIQYCRKKERQKEKFKVLIPRCLYREAFPSHEKAMDPGRGRSYPIQGGRDYIGHAIGGDFLNLA